ncbi:hypothetical protein SLS62_002181 [Diatrype stigma]|uniref:DUF7514 domain-containing protein n=1 Tax=Diatrype stigma TaxID=117547 RepID=A0AAN9V7C3_9PEZI
MTKETCQHRRNARPIRNFGDVRAPEGRGVAHDDDLEEEEGDEVVAPPHNAKGGREAGLETPAASSPTTSMQARVSDHENSHKQEPATTSTQHLEVPPLLRAELVPASFLGELRKAIREEVAEAIQKNQVPESAPGVRFSDRRTFAKRPAASRRTSSGISAASDSEQRLFDDSGCATARSARFLRELAKYITDEFAPRGSLVVTPEKLASFYARYGVEGGEVLPFIEIFSLRTTGDRDARAHHERVADLFSDLGCAYHLAPPPDPPAGAPFTTPSPRPQIPGLTPAGFCRYFTTCLLAYPDEEFRRLEKIVADVSSPSSSRPHYSQNHDSDGGSTGGGGAGGGSGGMVVVDCMLPRPFIRSLLPARHDPAARRALTTAFEGLIRDLERKVSSPSLSLSPSPSPAATVAAGTMSTSRSSPVPVIAAAEGTPSSPSPSLSALLQNPSSPAVVVAASHHPAEKRGGIDTETALSLSHRRYVPEAVAAAQHVFDDGHGGGGGEEDGRRSAGHQHHQHHSGAVVPAANRDTMTRHKDSEPCDSQRGAAPAQQQQQQQGVAPQSPSSGLPSLRVGGKKPTPMPTPVPEAADYKGRGRGGHGHGHGHEGDYFSGHHHHHHHHHHSHSHDHSSSRRYHPDYQPPLAPHQRQHRRQYSSGHVTTTTTTPTDPYLTPAERTNSTSSTPLLPPPPTAATQKFKSTQAATPNPGSGSGPGTPGLPLGGATGTIGRSYSVPHVPPSPLPPRPPAAADSNTAIPVATATAVAPTVTVLGTPLPPPPVGPFATPSPPPPSQSPPPSTLQPSPALPLPPPSSAATARAQSFIGQQQQQQQQQQQRARGAPQATMAQERYGGGGAVGRSGSVGGGGGGNNSGNRSSSSRAGVVDRGPTWDEVLGAQKSAGMGMGMRMGIGAGPGGPGPGLRRRDTVPAQLS